jgi:ABC-type lipoprotein release transport system permease subunit
MMTTMLVGVAATDPSTFAAVTLLFFLVATVASALPAARAAGLDANAALHQE